MGMVKFQCLDCQRRVYVNCTDVNDELPDEIKSGDAYPIYCPFCCEDGYGVLAKEDAGTKKDK